MDERWAKALRAKHIAVRDGAGHAGGHAADRNPNSGIQAARDGVAGASARRAQPFKATGHKGGISRQGG
ncbi:hypothetical protein JS533_004830 [Bifidobacterium amazonense]|uniref:Uncharacterized protein n=1 Tax=Bifidobacterium amazonense TaxID=2809027 RepID=A0ABS9VU29_9BIFI|nr:hypothetical protein [Bifidobacterium amazonense]MCH9275598.1 hypothetical protein [Bifidobacterium amazonense]